MSRPPRVLLVDDEPQIAEGLRMLLEDEGMELFAHTSLITLPLAIRNIDPDVILLDLTMPALSGNAVMSDRRRFLRTDAPVILFSGRGRDELSKLTEELGADGFIAKGDDLDEMLHRLRIWVQNHRVLNGATDATRPASTAA